MDDELKELLAATPDDRSDDDDAYLEKLFSPTDKTGPSCSLIHKERAEAALSRYISDKAERAWGM